MLAQLLMFDSVHARTCLDHAAYYGHAHCLQVILSAAKTTPVTDSWKSSDRTDRHGRLLACRGFAPRAVREREGRARTRRHAASPGGQAGAAVVRPPPAPCRRHRLRSNRSRNRVGDTQSRSHADLYALEGGSLQVPKDQRKVL
jgi:hypothetical protein